MFKSFFEARDALDAWMLSDPPLPSQRCAFIIFRILLENTHFTSARYGDVVHWKTSQETLAKLTGYKTRQVRDGLKMLHDLGLVKRYASRNGKSGSQPDRISVMLDVLEEHTGSAMVAGPVATETAIGAHRDGNHCRIYSL